MNEYDESFPKSPAEVSLGRRKLLLGSGGAIAMALVASACGSSKTTKTTTAPTTGSTGATPTTTGASTPASTPASGGPSTTAGAGGGDDLKIAMLAAGLEVLAVNTYTAAADAAGKGALGTVPPAVGEYVKTALAHHQEHLKALNGVITAAGGKAVTEPNATLAPVVADKFKQVKDVAGAAQLALELEAIAAQTYLSAIPKIKDPKVIAAAGAIQIVDQQHQAVLLFALGQYPVPDTFQKTEKAAAA